MNWATAEKYWTLTIIRENEKNKNSADGASGIKNAEINAITADVKPTFLQPNSFVKGCTKSPTRKARFIRMLKIQDIVAEDVFNSFKNPE